MNPDQDPNQSQYSIDYLNQIAPQQQKQPMNNRKFILFIGGGVLLIVVIGLLTLLSGGSGPTQKMQTLAARLLTLQEVSQDAQENIKSGQLRGINSNLTIFLTNTNRDIVEPLANNGVDIKKLDKSVTTKEALTDLKDSLEDARLNAVFDRTYAREMNYQLETLTTLMSQVYKGADSKSLKSFLETTNTNLTPIKEQLTKFSSTTD